MDSNNTMMYRIDLEKQNKGNDQVTELILDNCRASQINGLTEEFVNLELLSLINVGLTTLKGFPKLPKLKKLELSDNRLTGGLNLLHGSPNLRSLNISGNRIKDFEALEPLKEFHDLVSLDLYNCEITRAEDYRKNVFDLLPNLKVLDGFDREEREVADSDDDEDEGSDVENHATRDTESNDEEEAVDDDDDNEDGDADDGGEVDGEDDDEDDDDDEELDEEADPDDFTVELEDEYPCPDESDEEDEELDDEEDEDEGDAEDAIIAQNSNGDSGAVSSEHNRISNNASDVGSNDYDGGDDEYVQELKKRRTEET